MSAVIARYRHWFYAATVYNILWAVVVIVWPVPTARVIGIDVSAFVPFVQVIGMMVGVFAYGYYLLARDPQRYCGFIWIALAGKTLGPLGYAFYAAHGVLPWSFGWTCVFNDLIWWPAFWSFAVRYARRPSTPASP
ncbi:MAG TPA: hypothetical protein VFE69_09130 [Ilumatobacteraceae bacterium]|nr:hypothetical protein [Ilumatobacteraceae bacterium]